MHTSLDGLFRYAEFLNFGDIHVRFDHATGLRAIIAINSLKRGPGIGGCRCVHYESTDEAVKDAIRLAHMMSYKAAISKLNHGGAKAVLISPAKIHDRDAYFESFANFVNDLGGRYIAAVDSGTRLSDMDIIARTSSYVTCTQEYDPAPMTVLGVLRGIEAAVETRLQRENLEGIRVAIQGAGNVGYFLAKELLDAGCSVFMSDVHEKSLYRAVDELGVTPVAVDKIYDVDADVFAPCALGAILNHETVERLAVSIVAGSANNQLAHYKYAALMQAQGILYAPDFVINAGGLIYASAIYDHADVVLAKQQVENIHHTLVDIFARAQREHVDPHTVAYNLATDRLGE